MMKTANDDFALTTKAARRMRTGGIPDEAIDMLAMFGREIHSEGAVRFEFDRKGRRQIEAFYAPSRPPAKIMKTYMVVDGAAVVTIGYRNTRFRIGERRHAR